MKQHVILSKVWTLAIAMLLLPTISYASINDDMTQIQLNEGSWKKGISTRNLSSPFTAYYDECILTIHSGKPAYDLSITITNAQPGYTVYTLEVPKESSDFITIPLTGLGKGEYCLVISNPEAGYVYGTFNL